MFARITIIVLIFFSLSTRCFSQAEELEQLALNIEKLAQFKQILKDLESGYEILTKGYNAVKDVSEGNFNLHKAFLDGLLAVNPEIAKYQRVADIISYELKIASEYKKTYQRLSASGLLNDGELSYIAKVSDNIIDLSLNNIEDLITIITASKLRMSDDERLTAIDDIYKDIQDKYLFIRKFNGSNLVLALQAKKESNEISGLKNYYGIKK